MRRILGILGWLVFAAILLAVAGVIALDVGFQRERLTTLAVESMRDALGVEVAVERVDGRASRGLELHGVRIGPRDAPLAEIDRVRTRWRLWRLFGDDTRHIDSVRIDGARVILEQDDGGGIRVLSPMLAHLAAAEDADASATAEPPFSIGRVVLAEADVELRRPRVIGAEGISVERLSFAASGEAFDVRTDRASALPFARSRATLDLQEAVREDRGPPILESARVEFALTGDGVIDASVDARGTDVLLRAGVAGPLDAPGPLRFELRADELSRLAVWLPGGDGLAGRLDARGEVLGLRLDRPEAVDVGALAARFEAAGDLRAWPHSIGVPWPAGSASFDVAGRLDRGTLDVQRGVVEHSAGLHVELAGRVGAERVEDVEIAGSASDLARFASLLPPALESLEGAVVFSAELSGSPDAPTGVLRARADRLAWDARGPVDATIAVVAREGHDAEIDVELVAPAPSADERTQAPDDAGPVRVEAHGTVDTTRRTARFDMVLDAAILSRLEPSAPALEGRLALGGRVAQEPDAAVFDLRLEGTDLVVDETPIARVELATKGRAPAGGDTLDAELSSLVIDGAPGSVRVRLLRPARAALALDAKTGALRTWRVTDVTSEVVLPDGQSGEVDGAAAPRTTSIVLDASGRAGAVDTVHLAVDRLPLDALPRDGNAAPRFGGRLSLEARVDRAGGRLETRGRGEIERPVLLDRSFEAVRLDWNTLADAVEARVDVSLDEQTPLALAARLPVAGLDAWLRDASRTDPLVALDGTTFEATLDDFDVAFLAPFVPRTLRDPGGHVRGKLDGVVEGGAPRLHGRLEISEGGITVPLLRRRFAPITGEAVLDGDRLELTTLRLGTEARGARMQGSLQLGGDGSLPIEARIEFDRLPIARSALLVADVDGQIEVAGSLTTPQITGELSLPGVRVRVPAAEDPVLREIRLLADAGDHTLVETATTSGDFVTSSTIDVRLDVPPDARIRGQGAHLFVKGNARLASRPGEPLRIFGDGEVIHGTYTLQGRRFQVRRGAVRLVGDRDVDPVLDIEAQLPVSDIVAIVDVSGRLSSPIVRLRSEPARDEQDVLAYLLFGRPAEEIGATQTGSMNAAAARLVAGVAERELREVLGDAMPVDSIEIGADDEGNTSELGFGKYLRPDLYLRYVHTLGDEPADRVGVEYRLNDVFSVGSSVSTTGDAGLDLILRHDF